MFEKIKKIMEIKGITPYQLEKDTGISQSLFSAWKVGKGKPKIENLEKLATYFNVNITYFFTGEIIEKQQTNFSNEDILLARELNKTDKVGFLPIYFLFAIKKCEEKLNLALQGVNQASKGKMIKPYSPYSNLLL